MHKHERLKLDLETIGEGSMKAFGKSMQPLIESGSTLTFEKSEDYNVGDVVFCKVKGRYIGAHKVIKKDQGRWLIANNKGRENGWTRMIYGKVIKVNGQTF